MTTDTVNFKVGGDFITEHARDRVHDGVWEDALRFLGETFPTMSYDDRLAILKGDKALIGVNECELIDDPQDSEHYQRYMEHLRHEYCGIYWNRTHNTYFQPYARVVAWGSCDLLGPTVRSGGPNRWLGVVASSLSTKTHDVSWNKCWRSLAYANDPRNDMCTEESKHLAYKQKSLVLWKIVPAPPLWLPRHIETRHAYADYLEVRGLPDARGNGYGAYGTILRSVDDWEKAVIVQEAKSVEPVDEDEKAARAAETPKVSQTLATLMDIPETMESTLEAILGEQDFDSPVEPDPLLSSNYAWVSPSGAFYGCRFHEHVALASRILKHVCKRKRAVKDPDKTLEQKEKFLKISTSQVDDRLVYVGVVGKLTNEQRYTLFRWAKKNGHDAKELIRQAEI